jgi:hypothetical protein
MHKMHIQHPKPVIDLDLGHELRERRIDASLFVAPGVFLPPESDKVGDEGLAYAVFFGPLEAGRGGEACELEFLREEVEFGRGYIDLPSSR